jgi:hypothetical protein
MTEDRKERVASEVQAKSRFRKIAFYYSFVAGKISAADQAIVNNVPSIHVPPLYTKSTR